MTKARNVEPPALKARAKALGLDVVNYDQSLTMAIRRIEGGRLFFLRCVQLAAEAADPCARAFLTCYVELTATQRQKVNLDLLCMSAGVSRVDLLKTVVGTAFEHSCEVASLVAAAAHASIVDATIASAKRLDSDIGQKDRHDLLLHAGFLPTPKGATIHVSAHATAAAAAAASANADPSVPDFLADIDEASAARDVVQGQLVTLPPADAES